MRRVKTLDIIVVVTDRAVCACGAGVRVTITDWVMVQTTMFAGHAVSLVFRARKSSQ